MSISKATTSEKLLTVELGAGWPIHVVHVLQIDPRPTNVPNRNQKGLLATVLQLMHKNHIYDMIWIIITCSMYMLYYIYIKKNYHVKMLWFLRYSKVGIHNMALAHSQERKARGQQTKITDMFHKYIYINYI